ncbi:unnamed protein product [Calypogeia fissa]
MVESLLSAAGGFVMWRRPVITDSLVFLLQRFDFIVTAATQVGGSGLPCTVSGRSSFGAWERWRIHCRNDRSERPLLILSSAHLLCMDHIRRRIP